MERRKLLMAGAAVAAAGLITSSRQAQAATATTRSIFDFGAKGDGVTDDSKAFSAALQAGAANGWVIRVPSGMYAITNPIVFSSTNGVAQKWGLLCEGATLVSKITSGADVITMIANHSIQYFQLTGGLSVWGNRWGGNDGNGLRIFAPGGGTPCFFNFVIDGLQVTAVGGSGLQLEGNVFECLISNSYFQGNGKNGATFASNANGVCSAVSCVGSFFNGNDNHGIWVGGFDAQYNAARDVRVYGGYCRDNHGIGFYYSNGSGSSCIEQVGFENNCNALQPGDPNGSHVYALTNINMKNCSGQNNYGGATYFLRGWFNYLAVMEGCMQNASGAMGNTGKSRLAYIDGDGNGHVYMKACAGGIDKNPYTKCTWEAQNCSGPSPSGNLNIRGTVTG